MFAKEIINGGIADELYGAVKYDTTDYENFFPAPIILSGRIYYNAGTYPNYGYTCVDLRTGKTIWYKNGTDNGLNNPYTLAAWGQTRDPPGGQLFPQLIFGQLYHYYSLNGEGIKDHLWIEQTVQSGASSGSAPVTVGGATWYMIDANTGNFVMGLVNVPRGTSVTDQNGNLLLYNYNANTGNFLAWNVSQSIPPVAPTSTGQAQWEPKVGAFIDALNDTTWTNYGQAPLDRYNCGVQNDVLPHSGYTMNVTGPKGLPTSLTVLLDSQKVPKMMFLSAFSSPLYVGGSNDQTFKIAVVRIDEHVAPYSPFPNKTSYQNNNLGFGVTLLWSKSFTYPQTDNRTWSLGPVSYDDKVLRYTVKRADNGGATV